MSFRLSTRCLPLPCWVRVGSELVGVSSWRAAQEQFPFMGERRAPRMSASHDWTLQAVKRDPMERSQGLIVGGCETMAESTSAAVDVDAEGLLKRGLGDHPTRTEVLHPAGGWRMVRHLGTRVQDQGMLSQQANHQSVRR